MKKIATNYHESLKCINHQQYDEARALLEDVIKTNPNHSQLNWALGLIDAATGFPFDAIKRWKKVDHKQFPAVEKLLQSLEEQLPVYKKVFDQYNQGVRLAKNKQYEKARKYFALAFHQGVEHNLPLSIHIYKSYILSLLYSDKRTEALDLFKNAPLYIKNSSKLYIVQKVFQDQTEKRRTSKIWFSRISIAIVLVIVFFLGGLMSSEKDNDPAIIIEEQSSQLEELLKSETAIREQLEKQITLNQEYVNRMTTAEEVNQHLEEVFELVTVDLHDLEKEASYQAYIQGMEAYQNEDYTLASELLGKSFALKEDRYFSDDAIYFYIQSLHQLGESTYELMMTFLATENFIDSPYRDDIMLQLAQYHLTNHEINQAKTYLNRIITNYPDEWTAKKANELLEQMVGD